MSDLLIIGIGSPLGLDRIGWLAVEALAAAGVVARENIRISDRPGSALLIQMQGANTVILIDAVQNDASPGAVLMLRPEQLASVASPLSSHGFGVADALMLGESLAALPEKLRVVGIVVGTVDQMGNGSMQIEALLALAMPAVIKCVQEVLQS